MKCAKKRITVLHLREARVLILALIFNSLPAIADDSRWSNQFNEASKKLAAGDVLGAEAMAKSSLMEAKRFGLGDQRVGRSLGLLTGIYYREGRIQQTKQSSLACIPIIEKSMGYSSSELISPLLTLALLYSTESDHDRACKLGRRCLVITEKSYPESLPSVLTNLEQILIKAGKFEEARSVRERRFALEASHARTWDEMMRVSSSACTAATWNVAEKTAKAALTIALKEGTARNDMHVGQSLALLCAIYFNLGQYAQTSTTAMRAMSIFEKAPPAQKCQLLTVLTYLAMSSEKIGPPNSALKYYNRLFQTALSCKEKGALALAVGLENYRDLLLKSANENEYTKVMEQVPVAAIKELCKPKACRAPHAINFSDNYSIGDVYAIEGEEEKMLATANGRVNVDGTVPLELHVTNTNLQENTKSLAAIAPDEFWSLSFASSDIVDDRMACFGKLTDVHEIDLHSTAIGDRGLACLQSWKSLYVVNLGRTRVTLKGLSQLASNREPVSQLDLSNTDIDDRAADQLEHLPLLTGLALAGTKIKDPTAKRLGKLKHLESLNLSRTAISDAPLRYIAELPELKKLSLTDTNITNTGIKSLIPLTQLENLNLSRTKVTDAGLKFVGQLPSLKILALDGNQITMAGISQLQRLNKLRELSLFASEPTLVKKTQLLLPHCEVHGP